MKGLASGFFTAIDGPSGVGKTSVTELTSRQLSACGMPVLSTRQPSDSPLGLLARSLTHDLRGLPLTYLMAADRHHHYEQVIRPAVDAGRVVVCDRYVASALVLDQVDGAHPNSSGAFTAPWAGQTLRSCWPVIRRCLMREPSSAGATAGSMRATSLPPRPRLPCSKAPQPCWLALVTQSRSSQLATTASATSPVK